MTNNVIELGTLGRAMSPSEVLSVAQRYDWQDVVVLGFNEEGEAAVFTSRIDLGEFIALLKVAEKLAVDGITGAHD